MRGATVVVWLFCLTWLGTPYAQADPNKSQDLRSSYLQWRFETGGPVVGRIAGVGTGPDPELGVTDLGEEKGTF